MGWFSNARAGLLLLMAVAAVVTLEEPLNSVLLIYCWLRSVLGLIPEALACGLITGCFVLLVGVTPKLVMFGDCY
jgi:hypothetical protein